jgi:hypothetical protein
MFLECNCGVFVSMMGRMRPVFVGKDASTEITRIDFESDESSQFARVSVNEKLQDNNDSHFDRTKCHGCWICFVRISIAAYDQNGDLCVLEEM